MACVGVALTVHHACSTCSPGQGVWGYAPQSQDNLDFGSISDAFSRVNVKYLDI